MRPFTPLKLGEFCRRLGVRERAVRYAYERGFHPAGVDEAPGRGEHRLLTLDQCLWLAVLLKLRDAGLRLPAAKTAADFTIIGARTRLERAAGFPPEPPRPFDRWTGADRCTAIEVGDSTHVRSILRHEPGSAAGETAAPWFLIPGFPVEGYKPVVTIRVDVDRLVELLSG